MTRKKKPFARQKRQQVTDASGWTHIVKGIENLLSTPESPYLPLRTSLTTEEYADKFKTLYTPQWQESSCLQDLKRIFQQHILMTESITLTKCVCLGLGSPIADIPSTSYQLAALATMLEMLSVKHDIQEVVFQDPVFHARDKTFLIGLGHTVVDNPEAFSKIDENTFLFAPHLEFEALATALENSLPAVCITNDVSCYVDGLLRHHAEGQNPNAPGIFERYLNQTVSMAMPEFDRMDWTIATEIYWRKSTPH